GLPNRPRRLYHPVIVVDDHFPISPVTMSGIRSHIASRGYLGDDRITQLEVISLDELDHVEAVAEAGGPTFQQLLEGKNSARLRDMHLVNYMRAERGLVWTMSSSVDRLFSELLPEVLDMMTPGPQPGP
ncbi:hypothetical protein, partial [Frankia sp. AvcI1]